MFAFWGRRANVELQLPFIRRILEEHPEVEFHGWDLARDIRDSRYLRTIKGERITIQTAFYGPIASRGQTLVWKHYAQPQYRDCVFVKLDDDDVFLETGAFDSFINAARNRPDSVISATVINNGACTRLIPDIWDMFQALDIPLLDVHLSAEYAEKSHRWFFDNWQTITGQPMALTPCEDWLSINCLAYTYQVGVEIAALLGQRSPRHIAGRDFTPRNRIGDEGAANMLPRYIHRGFVCGHLNFGPQIRDMDDALYTELRKQYADIGLQYLEQ